MIAVHVFCVTKMDEEFIKSRKTEDKNPISISFLLYIYNLKTIFPFVFGDGYAKEMGGRGIVVVMYFCSWLFVFFLVLGGKSNLLKSSSGYI